MATAANTRVTESGLVLGAADAGEIRITADGLILGAADVGEIRITAEGVVLGAKDYGELRGTLSGIIIGVLPCVPPSAPTGFTVTSKGDEVILSWTNPAISGGTVNIFRSTSPGSETQIASGISSALGNYTDTVPAVGVPYYYEIDFVSSCGEGTKSGELTIVPQCCGGEWSASPAPAQDFSAAAAPSSSYSASAAPAQGASASAPPTTTWTASSPPTGTYTGGGCPG